MSSKDTVKDVSTRNHERIQEAKSSIGWSLRSLRNDLMRELGAAAYEGNSMDVESCRLALAETDALIALFALHGIDAK